MLRPNHRRFAILLAATALLWLVVFPWMARWPTVEDRSAWLKEIGVTPAAFMYADHAVADKTLRRLDEWNAQHRDALWRPTRWRETAPRKKP